GDEGDAVLVAGGDDRAAPGDALAGVVRPVLHQLLGRDVHGEGHRAPPGLSRRRSTSSSTWRCSTASETKRTPRAVTTAQVGQIRRPSPGPPVAESPSAASYRPSTAPLTARCSSMSGCQSFFSAPRANSEPEPTLWWRCSS